MAPAPAHLLMYSAFSCFPQVLHLKQPKCQCLSKATRDWPFLISVPQPPQPGRKTRARGRRCGLRGAEACTAGRPDARPEAVRAARGVTVGTVPLGVPACSWRGAGGRGAPSPRGRVWARAAGAWEGCTRGAAGLSTEPLAKLRPPSVVPLSTPTCSLGNADAQTPLRGPGPRGKRGSPICRPSSARRGRWGGPSPRERKWAAGAAGSPVRKDRHPLTQDTRRPWAPRHLPRWAGSRNGLAPAWSLRPPVAPGGPSTQGKAGAHLTLTLPRVHGTGTCPRQLLLLPQRKTRVPSAHHTRTRRGSGLRSPWPQVPRVRRAPTGSSEGLLGGLELTVEPSVCVPPGRLPGGGGPELGQKQHGSWKQEQQRHTGWRAQPG